MPIATQSTSTNKQDRQVEINMLNTFSVIVKIISDENCFPALKAENFPRFSKIPTFRLRSVHVISYRGSESKWVFFTAPAARRLGTTLSAPDMRSALRRVPDLSRKHDGRGVNADPIRISDAQAHIPFTTFRSAQGLEGRIRRLISWRRSVSDDKSGHEIKAFQGLRQRRYKSSRKRRSKKS